MQNVYCYTLLHCPLYTRNYFSCMSKQTCSCSHSVYEPVNTLPGKCNRLIFVHKPPFTLKHNFTQTNSKGSQTNLHKQLMKNGLGISVFSNAGNVVYFTNQGVRRFIEMKSQTSDISLWMNTTSPHEGGGLAGQRVTGNSGKFEILKEFLENLSLTGEKIANVGETLDAFFSDKQRNSYIRSIFPYSCFSRRDHKTHWRSSQLILHPLTISNQ